MGRNMHPASVFLRHQADRERKKKFYSYLNIQLFVDLNEESETKEKNHSSRAQNRASYGKHQRL